MNRAQEEERQRELKALYDEQHEETYMMDETVLKLTCIRCGKEFYAVSSLGKYCSSKCAREAAKERKKEREAQQKAQEEKREVDIAKTLEYMRENCEQLAVAKNMEAAEEAKVKIVLAAMVLNGYTWDDKRNWWTLRK